MELPMMPYRTTGARASCPLMDMQMRAGRPRSFPSLRRFAIVGVRAFTLLELLVVIAIIGLLMGLLIPSIGSILQGTNIEQGARAVFDQISLARQVASTRNCTAEIRLIKLTNVSPSGYNAIQIWVPGPNATMVPINKVVTLPKSAVISSDQVSLSRILDPNQTGTVTTSNMPPGGAASGAPYFAFSIRPPGDVVPGTTNRANLYLTVVPPRAATNSTLPPNYATIQLNPDTGSPMVFRP